MTTTKTRMELFVEFINNPSHAAAEKIVSADAVFHVPGRPEPEIGPSGYLEIIAMMRSGFSDVQWVLEETITEGDNVAARFTMRGTHDGNFFGVPATRRQISVQAMNFYRWSGDKIIAERGQPDLLGLLQQIGAVSAS
ncbi:ester cyclase [Rhizobium leguminosarum]|uniref:ester cyclase n=1 Tax=Rhizobium leguminosarum TaxID=384 RepID=UPI001C93EC25|nr:ester cyclase [Rhizobium leguminosarum]MBY5571719.1 ester cyclase [Rhizobium leguminosarum]MBY5578184.1 ester cyclase [Rhizobium leguminosarum]